MTDAALIWDPEAFSADLGLALGGLETDDGLRTALLISLFSDRRAQADDELPEPGADLRGWWGDVAAQAGDRLGSRLWLLVRAKRTQATLNKAREFTREATAWLIEDGVAAAVEIEAGFPAPAALGVRVEVVRPAGTREKFDFIWSAV